MGSGIGSRASRNVCRVSRYGPAGVELATTAATRGRPRACKHRADAAHGVARDRGHGHFGPRDRGTERRKRFRPELAGAERQLLGRVRPVGADVKRQAVEPRRVEEERHRERSVASGFPAVDEHDRRSGRATACRDEPGGQVEPIALHRQGFRTRRPRSRGVTFGTFRRGYPARTRYASANRYASPSWAAAMAAAKPARRMVPTTSRGRQTGQPVKWCLRAGRPATTPPPSPADCADSVPAPPAQRSAARTCPKLRRDGSPA